MRRLFTALTAWLLLAAAAPPVTFVPAGAALRRGGRRNIAGSGTREGPRIVAALEAATGLAFPADADRGDRSAPGRR